MNMHSHTGGTMSFGFGIVHAKSSTQKLNTKSSTEAELVAVSEYLSYHIWMVNFMKSQGYEIKNKVLFQDNQSADFFTKPLEGSAFTMFRKAVMGHDMGDLMEDQKQMEKPLK